MIRPTVSHFSHHRHFYLALVAGLVAWGLAAWLRLELPLSIGGDVFFGVFLASMYGLAQCGTAAQLRRRSAYEDEGKFVILLLTLGALALIVGSIFVLLAKDGHKDPWQIVLALSTVPLGFLALHTVMAFHYAHIFYGRADKAKAGKVQDTGGLEFPGTPEPTAWDFLYYSFVVGMTAQVSDVDVHSGEMRRLTLVHGLVSYLFNTVVLALAVNVAIGQGGS
jgi:uncharacterized membrane protein